MPWLESIQSGLAQFPLVFIPLFVTMDPLGLLPFVVGILDPLVGKRRGQVIRLAILTGTVIGVVFLALGRAIFDVLGINIPDFLIAGGAILFIVSLRNLISEAEQQPVVPSELMAVVPIGTPLLVGPATVSMLIVLTGLHPVWLVLAAFILNMGIAWLVMVQAERIQRVLGVGGLRAFSKVASLLLAAIAVQLVRQGIMQIVRGIGA